MKTDFLLKKYSVICMDEVHERTVDSDILIGCLSRIVKMRRELANQGQCKALKLILMSATLATTQFTAPHLFTPQPPVHSIPARTHPVTIHFSRKTPDITEYMEEVAIKIKQIDSRLPPGGILAFLPGMEDIHQMCQRLQEETTELHILPLYSMLSTEQQLHVFQPPPEGKRLCVIATNVAETSITIPDIIYVVDAGLEKRVE